MFRKRLPLVLTAILTASSGGRAGCLAPADTAIDVSVGSGPLWGNDGGSLLYARQPSAGHATLTLRPATGLRDDVAVEGDSTPFLVGSARETWSAFHSGTVNASDDVAFVASTTLPDDPGTPQNEHVARRGVYARSGNSLYEIARFGAGSPVLDVFNSAVPWGTLFDAVTADLAGSGYVTVVFSGQLAGQNHFAQTQLRPDHLRGTGFRYRGGYKRRCAALACG